MIKMWTPSQFLLVLLSSFLLRTMALPPFLGVVNEDPLWKAKDILNLLLPTSIFDRCTFLLLTDQTIDFSTVQKMFLSWKYGGAHFEAEAITGYGNFTQQLITQIAMVDRARRLRLQSWCVTVVVISNDPDFLAAFAEASDNGRLLVWDTRLLVITKLGMPIVQALLQDFWIFSMMKTMFLKLRNTSRWQVFVHLPYSPSGPQVVPVATWNPGSRLVFFDERVPFPDKYQNFYGTPVNLTWLPLKPYWTETKQQGPDGKEILSYQGREYLIMLAMGAALNFSLRPLPYEGWDSVLGRLRTREAFMWPVNFPILPHMVKEYDFSFFLERSTLAFTMAKPSIKPRWQSLYYPLKIDVWIYILVTSLFVFIVLLLMNRDYKNVETSAWLVMKQVLGALLDEAIPGELPLMDSTRVALTAWLIFSFIVGSVYRSNLTACLTVPKYPPRLENLAQLADSGAKITVVAVMELFASSFRQSESQVLKTIAERMVFVPTSKEGIGQALKEFSVHMRERLFMEVIIEDYYTNRDGSTDLYVTQESLLADFSAFVLIRDAPFKNKIDKCMMAFHTGGLIDKWKEMVMDVVRREGRQRRRLLGNEDDNSAKVKIKPLTMVHMQGPFLLYVVCAIVSSVAFFGEGARGTFL